MSVNPGDEANPEDSPEDTESLDADQTDDFDADLGDADKAARTSPILGPP